MAAVCVCDDYVSLLTVQLCKEERPRGTMCFFFIVYLISGISPACNIIITLRKQLFYAKRNFAAGLINIW